MNKCKECMYCNEIDKYVGECRLNPPHLSNEFPRVELDWWCGKLKLLDSEESNFPDGKIVEIPDGKIVEIPPKKKSTRRK